MPQAQRGWPACVGDGGRWWIIVLSSQRGTFVNVWLVLNGLLLDYRVWGPKLDRPLLFGESPSRVSCDWALAICWQRGREEEGGGHFCYAALSKCFIVLHAARSCLAFCKSLHVEVAGLKITRHRKIKQKNHLCLICLTCYIPTTGLLESEEI